MTTTITDPSFLGKSGTPPWSEIIKSAISAALLETHVWLPAIVREVLTPNRVTVQPMLMRKYLNLPAPVPLPPIQDCMVIAPRGTTYGMTLPVAVGDTGIALFCERSLDVWSVAGGIVDPLDNRHHSLSDAVFVPGLYPFNQPVPPPVSANPTDMVLFNGKSQMYLQKSGGFKLTNGTPTSELMTILLESLTQIQAGFAALGLSTTATLLGPQPLSSAAALTSISQALTKLVAAITPLVGA